MTLAAVAPIVLRRRAMAPMLGRAVLGVSVCAGLLGCTSANPSTQHEVDSTPPAARTEPAASSAEDIEQALEALEQRRQGADASTLAELETEVRRLLERHPDHPRALALLADLVLERGKPEPAREIAERCVAKDATRSECWLVIGVTSELARDRARAQTAYARYVELAPDGRYVEDARQAIERLGDAKADSAPASADVLGEADGKAVRDAIDARTPALRECYEARLEVQPELEGKVTYQLQIATDGRVTSIVVAEDTVEDATMLDCTRTRIDAWRFPEAKDSAEVTFSVVFSAGDDE